MRPSEHEFLASHPLVRTDDLSEARHCVTQKFCDHRLTLAARAPLSLRHNHVAGQAVSLNYLHYGADVAIDPGMLGGFYLLQIPLSGGAEILHRGAEVTASAATASLLNPDRETRMRWGGNCRKLLLQIDKGHLQSVAEALTGTPMPGAIRFDPGVDLTRPQGRRLRQLVIGCALACERDGLFERSDARDTLVEHELAAALLSLQPSNISHILAGAARQALPRDIRRALEVIHANLAGGPAAPHRPEYE
ncbi:MAG: AraC family transcriptional regulator, partial [Pseudomonadota bacterium]